MSPRSSTGGSVVDEYEHQQGENEEKTTIEGSAVHLGNPEIVKASSSACATTDPFFLNIALLNKDDVITAKG